MTSRLKSYEFRGSHFRVTRGDYAPILQKVVEHLEKAKVGLRCASSRSLWAAETGVRTGGWPDRPSLPPTPQAYAANSRQEQMLVQYIESFTQGSIEAHKRGSRFWIQDKGPIVER